MASVYVALLPTPDQEPRHSARKRVAAQSRGGRAALAAAARAAGCPRMRFEKDSADVPLEAGGWHWSVTHDDTWVAGALAQTPIGVDLERITLRRAALRDAVLNGSEQALLGDVDALGFTRLWTAKEAVLKAAGVGLSRLSHCRLAAGLPALLATPPGESGEPVPMTLDGEPTPVLQFQWGDHVLALHVEGAAATLNWILPEGGANAH